LPRILQFLRDPTSAWISGQDPEVGLVYVTDVCDAILRAATSPKASGLAFNVSAIEGYRMRELGERIAERTGLRSPTRSVPLWVARPLAALLEDGARLLRRKQPPSLTRYELSVMMEGNPWDVTRARALLGWEPKVSPAEGIARMMDWARAEGMV
jgi:nucleoside-diphosphate-sugar epimerase